MKFLSRLLKDDEELTRKTRSGVEEEKQVEGRLEYAGTRRCWSRRGFQSHSGDTLDSRAFGSLNCPCVYRFWNGLKAKREISEPFCPRCIPCCGLGRLSGNQLAWQTWSHQSRWRRCTGRLCWWYIQIKWVQLAHPHRASGPPVVRLQVCVKAAYFQLVA